MKINFILMTSIVLSLAGCQLISPIFVDYYGVRRDVAQWINKQTFLSMQEKRSLAQLSRAQQKLVRIDQISESQKLEISKLNSIAMHCAQQYVSTKKINELQNQVFKHDSKERILTKFDQEFPKIKLDINSIECD